MLKGPVYHIVGVDAQASLGPAATPEENLIIGKAVTKDYRRNWKDERFADFMLANSLVALNTFSADETDTYLQLFWKVDPQAN